MRMVEGWCDSKLDSALWSLEHQNSSYDRDALSFLQVT